MLKISSKERHKLKKNMLELFDDENNVKPERLKHIHNQMLFFYGASDNTIEEIIDEDHFPAESFVKKLLLSFRQVRTEFLEKLKTKQIPENNDDQVELSLLIGKIGKHAALAQNEINKYLNSPDNWLSSIGAELAGKLPSCKAIISELFNLMEKFGDNERPYNAGNTLVDFLKDDPSLFDLIYSEYRKRNSKFKEAILSTFYLVEDLPLTAEKLIIEASSSSEKKIEVLSVIALSNLKYKRSEAIEILTYKLDSEKWSIRGNASYSLALLKVTDIRIIKKIESLIHDNSGNCDWGVQDTAVNALGEIGASAIHSVPALLSLLSDYHDDMHETNADICMKQEICLALGNIGHDSDDVIDAITKVVEQRGWISAPSAIIALGKFGPKSAKAIPAIRRYIYGDSFDCSDEKMEALWEALVNIDGYDSEIANKILLELEEGEKYLQKIMSENE